MLSEDRAEREWGILTLVGGREGGREGGPEYEIRPSLKDFTFAGSQWLSSVLLTPGLVGGQSRGGRGQQGGQRRKRKVLS